MTTRTEKISFRGHSGHMLDARLELPAEAPAAYALFAHCFTCAKETLAATRLSRALTEHGFGVLRFDFTGLGGSEGDFANTGFSSNVEDLVRAADHLREHFQAPALLVGHSLGGAAVLRAATRIPECRAVSTLNAPFDPAHVKYLLGPSTEKLEREGRAEVILAGRTFTLQRSFLEDIEATRMEPTLRELGRALLIFHAPTDSTVGVDNARRIFEAARHPKSFVSLDGADHLLTRREDVTFVASVLGAWVQRYVEPALTKKEAVLPEVGWARVQESGEGLYTQRITVGRHTFRADEPESCGGADLGPSPYDLLTAALGACTSMTLRMYARTKQWPLEHVEVRLRHRKVHAQDCPDCETREGKIDQMDREILLRGPLTEEQRQRLLEIADRCPVHRTLHSEVKVRSVLLPPAESA